MVRCEYALGNKGWYSTWISHTVETTGQFQHCSMPRTQALLEKGHWSKDGAKLFGETIS